MTPHPDICRCINCSTVGLERLHDKKPNPACEYPACTADATMTFGTDFTPVCDQHSGWHTRDESRAPAVEPERDTSSIDPSNARNIEPEQPMRWPDGRHYREDKTEQPTCDDCEGCDVCRPGTLMSDTTTNNVDLHLPSVRAGRLDERARIEQIIDPVYETWLSRHPCDEKVQWHVQNYISDLRHAIAEEADQLICREPECSCGASDSTNTHTSCDYCGPGYTCGDCKAGRPAAVMPDGSTAGNVYDAYSRGVDAERSRIERIIEMIEQGSSKPEWIHVPVLLAAIRDTEGGSLGGDDA